MVTRKELALAANVSESTVTRVLNGGYASEETRQKVLALAEQLNYTPNALAKGLRTRRTQQIACIVLSIDNPFYGQMMLGVEDMAHRHGYVLTMYSAAVIEQGHGSSFFQGRHDGIILLSINPPGLLERLKWVRVPVIAYHDAGPHPELDSVYIDLNKAVQAVVRHLVQLGHRHIGYIGTFVEQEPNPRWWGFHHGIQACGLSIAEQQLQVVYGSGTMESGYTGMAELYRKFPDVTAVIAMNDLIAFGAMRWMQDQGIRIPHDVSIVGCDDIPYSAMCHPPLTTIQIPKREIGCQLMQLLLDRMQNSEDVREKRLLELPTRLVLRGTVANARVMSR
ncbi:MAG: LacI family transcriptional regulator [Alicyclobacillus sp.]|nr:LacI family transcriptional regulator [Alicyclobacillus sp.]